MWQCQHCARIYTSHTKLHDSQARQFKLLNLQIKTVFLSFHRFTSNFNENGGGFQLVYESSQVLKWSYNGGACGGSFTTPNGILTSPSYPDNYPNKANCNYTISQPNGTAILLNFMSMDIQRHEEDKNCFIKDYLEIRDGPTKASSLWKDKLCGSDIPAPIQFSQNQLWMM